MTSDEELVVSKTRDLMRAIDRARRYRMRVASAFDFATTLLAAAVVCLGLYLSLTYIYYAYGFGPGAGSATVVGILIMAAAAIAWGVIRAERKTRKVRTGDWQADLEEGFPGALKLLTGLDWASAINDSRVARVGSVLYGFMKIAVYAALLSVFFDIGILGADLLAIHGYVGTILGPYWFVPSLALVLTAAASAEDMKKRLRESSALDSLVWELRVFSTGFARSEFKA